jgi:transcriptional regulator with XRE-family HTH domain
MALELGCSEIYLSRRLTGKVPFNVAELAKIARLLDVPLQAFFEVPTDLGVRNLNNRRTLRSAA